MTRLVLEYFRVNVCLESQKRSFRKVPKYDHVSSSLMDDQVPRSIINGTPTNTMAK